jgi:hypothetical protein
MTDARQPRAACAGRRSATWRCRGCRAGRSTPQRPAPRWAGLPAGTATASLCVVWCGVVWCGVVWCGVVWCGVVWCGVVWCGVVWCVVCGVWHTAEAGQGALGRQTTMKPQQRTARSRRRLARTRAHTAVPHTPCSPPSSSIARKQAASGPPTACAASVPTKRYVKGLVMLRGVRAALGARGVVTRQRRGGPGREHVPSGTGMRRAGAGARARARARRAAAHARPAHTQRTAPAGRTCPGGTTSPARRPPQTAPAPAAA